MIATRKAKTQNGTQPKPIRLVLFLLLLVQYNLALAQDEATINPFGIEQKPIELNDSTNGHVVDFHQLSKNDEEWARTTLSKTNPHSKLAERFQVTLSTSDANSPAMLGTYVFSGNSLRFQPRFPFQKGANYLARQLVKDGEPFELSFSVPVEKTEPARVAKVYPTGEVLPENLLKFYVHFSAPMRHGDIYEHVRIEKADGTPVELPFLEIDQELWSRDGLRITLLLDPGRIKRGLKPREEMGPIFEAGGQYRLVISDSWFDANGNPLAEEFVKSFTAGDVDDEQPNPIRWKFELPVGQTTDPVILKLDEACDAALLTRVFQIDNQLGNPYLKSVELGDNESELKFYPEGPWWPGMYNLKLSGVLEDLCGNSIDKKFDIDVFRATRQSDDIETTEIEFEIK